MHLALDEKVESEQFHVSVFDTVGDWMESLFSIKCAFSVCNSNDTNYT